MDWAAGATELLWVGGVTAIPVAVLAAVACRWPGCRPATRHAMWAAVLVSFVTPAIASLIWRPGWFSSGRVIAAAKSAVQAAREELTLGTVVTPRVMRDPGALTTTAPRGAPTRVISREAMRAGREELPGRAEHRSRTTWNESVDTPWLTASGPVSLGAPKTGAMESSLLGSAPGLVALDERPSRATPPVSQKKDRAAARTEKLGKETGMVDAPAPAAARRPEPSARGGQAAPSPAAAPSLRAAAAESGWEEEFMAWVGQAVAVRDALASVPPLPASVWGGGMAVLTAIGVGRWMGARRVLRNARPAGAGTMGQVAEAARELGMTRVPRTLVTGDRVSPMVWCGARPVLVLPAGLWRELESGSRRAVLLHELAHLRRRDHWLSWVAWWVGLVYWWHPVAWWARARVRDEADAACDAWVTSLMPSSRRVYAEALVTTKWYLSQPGRRMPAGVAGAGALGVMSGRTRKLARRLKMVMTERVSPRTSRIGALMVACVIGAGAFVMPGLACPPEEQAAERAAKEREITVVGQQKAARAMEKAAKAAKAPKAKTVKGSGVEFFGEAPALEAMKRDGAAKASRNAPPGGEDEMFRRLEERMRRLEEQLRRLEGSEHGASSGAHSMGPGVHATHAPEAVVVELPRLTPGAVTVSGKAAPTVAQYFASEDSGDVAREYTLPEGKLKALTELMARDDVPVTIERHDDKIVVHAPESKQRVFAAFVKLIHPEADLPGADMAGAANVFMERAKSFREAHVKQLEELKSHLKMMERQHRDAERDATRARQRSESGEEQVDHMREQIDALRERAAEAAGTINGEQLEKQVAELVARVEARAQEVASQISEADIKETILDQIEGAIDQINSAIEQLEQQSDDEDAPADSEPALWMAAPAGTVALVPPVAPAAPVAGFAPVAPVPPVAPVGAVQPVAPVPPVTPVAPVQPSPVPAAQPAPPAPPTPAPTPKVAS